MSQCLDFISQLMGVKCQHIAVITSYQKNLELPKITNGNMVDTMWKVFADVSTHSNCIFRFRKDNHKIWYCGNGLLQVTRDCNVDLVEAGDKVELLTISELVSSKLCAKPRSTSTYVESL